MFYYRAVFREMAHLYDIDTQIPYEKLNKKFKNIILRGSEDEIWGRKFEGILAYLERLFRETDNDWLRDEISRFMSILPCPKCQGNRLKKESLAIKISDRNISEITSYSIKEAKEFFTNLRSDHAHRSPLIDLQGMKIATGFDLSLHHRETIFVEPNDRSVFHVTAAINHL